MITFLQKPINSALTNAREMHHSVNHTFSLDDNAVNDDCKLQIYLLPVSESYPLQVRVI